MAFSASEFIPIGPIGNSDAPRHWSYQSADSKATMVASGYFDDAALKNGLQVNDIIHAVGAIGGTETLTVIHVEANTAGVITVTSFVQTLS
jgi:hypothetical protein